MTIIIHHHKICNSKAQISEINELDGTICTLNETHPALVALSVDFKAVFTIRRSGVVWVPMGVLMVWPGGVAIRPQMTSSPVLRSSLFDSSAIEP